MVNETLSPAWLQGYASAKHDWHKHGHQQYWRRLGLVEGLFDMDGTGFEGRADLNMILHVEVRTSLDLSAFRVRIALAWAVLRQRHILMASQAVNIRHISSTLHHGDDRAFLYTPYSSVDELYHNADMFCDFMDDYYPSADPDDFYLHLMNTGRAIDPAVAMSRLIVLPFEHSTSVAFTIRFILVAGHQVADGLTTFRWMNSFIDLLNLPSSQLDSLARTLCDTSPTSRLPPAQEALYPPVTGSPARKRWFWLITRILRHIAHTNPPSFQNPLCRSTPLATATSFPVKYPRLLNYTTTPKNNSYTVAADLPPRSTQRLIQLCRSTNPPISIGSGLFALVALSMMKLHEQLPLHIHCPASHLPFVGSFPLNPRPFLSGTPTTGAEDSLMLAFSDGITLPFLPSHLPLENRFRLLGLQAHRQLKQYQKRRRTEAEELALGAKSARFLLPTFFLASQDRWKLRWQMLERQPLDGENTDFQGAYPPAIPKTLATCGISSVGDRTSLIARGKYDVHVGLTGDKDVVVDFRNMWSFVRPRDGEFLVGAAGNRDGGTEGGTEGTSTSTNTPNNARMSLGFGVSFDGNAIDPARVGEWKAVIQGLLEEEEEEEDPVEKGVKRDVKL